MKFTTTTALLVASASAAWLPTPPAVNLTAPVWSTEVVTALTTYCPLATLLEHGGVTYTVTKPTTLTITNCPCTITHSSSSWTSVPTTTPVAPVVTAPVVTKPVYTTPVYTTPVYTTPSAAPYTYKNATTVVPYASAPSASKVTSSGPLQATANAANNAIVRSGAALAGVVGAVAYLL